MKVSDHQRARFTAGLVAVLASVAGIALTVAYADEDERRAEGSLVPGGAHGYWWYQHNPKPPAELPPSPTPEQPPDPQRPKDCNDEAQWTPDCGFVVPKSYEFQSRMRDALLQGMAMNPGDPEAVKAAQQYFRWVTRQALYAAEVAQHNKINDASLDPESTSPISAFGLRLAMNIGSMTKKLVWDTIRDSGGILILFTKDDCDFCHAQVQPLQSLIWDTKLELWNASIGGQCLEAFSKQDRCVPLDDSMTPAQILGVDVVPSLYLHLPGNVWIRVTNGLTDASTIQDRLYNLFVQWRTATLDRTKETKGTGLALDPEAMPKNTQELRDLLMTPLPDKP